MDFRPKFTDQQFKAISIRGTSIALSAGAGCGKTFVLTQRYLAALEPDHSINPEFDLHSLVAITFTERAAREMRDRIRAACGEKLRNCPAAEVVHWLAVLRGLDAARISTIHSFCTGLLRTQTVEAGLDPRFDVLEPPLADTLLRRVIRDSFHGLVESGDEDATLFVIDYGLERAKELLRRLTRQRFQIDFDSFFEQSPEQLEADWIRRWHTEFVPMLIEDFRSSSAVRRTMEAIANAPSTHEKMKERIANLHLVLSPQAVWQDALPSLQQIRENATIQGGGGKKDWVSDELKEKVKSAFEKLRAVVVELIQRLDVSQEDVITATQLACRALRLAHRMADAYAEAKQMEGVLDFDDLLLHARNLLRDNASVRQRVAAGIRLLMVDEFQDTDPVQADLVRSLCGATLTAGKLFMVGDRKQSIYRFRRADPTVFTKMRDELPALGRLPLNVNFRSQPAVLNFVNHLFAPAMDGYEPLTPFSAEQCSPTPAIEFLFATFDASDSHTLAPADSDFETGDFLLSGDDSRPNAAQLRTREADWIARRIAVLLSDPTPRIREKTVDANGRPRLRRAGPGDIVLLFRALSNVQEYERALRRYGLEYYLVGGKAFFAQQEVFDLLNLCQYLDDCDDHVALIGLLRSPFFNLSDDALQALAFHTSPNTVDDQPSDADTSSRILPDDSRPRAAVSLHQAIYSDPPAFLPQEQKERIRFASEVLTDLRARKDRMPLVELLTRAIERTGYDASLLGEFLGSRKLANLRKLVEMARQFDQGQFFTLKDFVTRLKTSVLEETDEEFATTLPESGNVIRLMSIHQSKGLEFPIVIVADIDRKGPPQGSDAVLHPQLGALVKPPEKIGVRPRNLGIDMYSLAEKKADAEETIRLFYVACTRAADYLILSTGLDEAKPIHSPWFELIESRFDTRTGLPKTDPLLGSSASATAGRELIPEIFVHPGPCPVLLPNSAREKPIPLSQLPGSVLAAEPTEFPPSARQFPRDLCDIATISVSRLETIDEALSGRQHTARPRRPAQSDEEEVDVDLATSLGTLVHTVLEQVDFREPDSWPCFLVSAVSQSKDSPSNDVVDQAKTMLARFFDSPIAAELAQAKSIFREIDFALPWPSKVHAARDKSDSKSRPEPTIIGIIDLLIETDEGWHVLDYKTGDFPCQTADDQFLVPYELQLCVYAHAVQQWFGVVPKELSLIAFRPEVRRITLPWSSARWQQVETRIDRAIESLKAGT